MEAETTIRALLGTACREAVELFDAVASSGSTSTPPRAGRSRTATST